MKKPLLTISLIALTVLSANYGFTQTTSDIELQESLMEHWNSGMTNVKTVSGASTAEFNTFTRFYESALNSERMAFLNNIRIGKITSANIASAQAEMETEWNTRFKEFIKLEKDYPSTIDEYRNVNRATTSCNPSPTNIDFEAGTLNGWNAYYAENSSTATAFSITGMTGGPAGAVTKAGGPDPSSNHDYQIKIMSGPGVDLIDPAIPVVSPYGGHYSVRLGDTTIPWSQMAILSQQFTVTTSSQYLNYQFAILIENPAGHTYHQQPFFRVTMLDQLGDTIPCSSYFVDGLSHLSNYKVIYDSAHGDSVWCLNWTPNFVNLSKYVGQCITLQFMDGDCALGAHFCYAYVDASMSSVGILESSPAICAQKSITLTGPPGLGFYKWTGPANGIVGSDSTQIITVDSAGTYTLITTPFGGPACNDTLSCTVTIAPGAPPKPSFIATTICAGQPTTFTNTSNSIAGSNFYWDFYNTGNYEDSAVNPIWTYAIPGTYTVKLHQVHYGCGADTLINIKVDSSAAASYGVITSCVDNPAAFTNSSTGANGYTWYFGDPSSGSSDTSNLTNPSHSFTSAGTYTVTLIAANGGPCPDTSKQTVIINVCTGVNNITSNATGAKAYPTVATNELTLEFAQSVKDVRYVIVNTLGQKLGAGTISGQKAVVNISNLAQGMYVIRLTDNTGMSISDIKFIKQ